MLQRELKDMNLSISIECAVFKGFEHTKNTDFFLLSCCRSTVQLKSSYGILGDERCKHIWFEKRRLNSNIKCECRKRKYIRFSIYGNMCQIWQKITMFTKLEYLMVWSFSQRNAMLSYISATNVQHSEQIVICCARILGSMSQKL